MNGQKKHQPLAMVVLRVILVAALILLLLAAIIISQVVGIAVMVIASNGAIEPTAANFMTHLWPGMLVAAIVEAILAIIIYRFLGKCALGNLPESVTIKRGVNELLLGVMIGGVAITLSTLFIAILGVYRVLAIGSLQGVLIGFALGLGAGVAEETLFRGVILRLLNNKFGPLVAILATSFIFGLSHYGNNGSVAEVISVFIAAGLLLNGVWYLTKNLWICVGTHFAWNFFLGGIFGMPVSGFALPHGGLLLAQLTGSDLITGGVSGPEA